MLKLSIPGMTCAHCARTIEKAVLSVDPAARVNSDLASSSVTVDTVAPAPVITDAIKEAGYDSVELASKVREGEET